MAGPKTRFQPPQPIAFFCAICDDKFPSKDDYNQHMANHPEPAKKKAVCVVCDWSFADTHQLEQHRIASAHHPTHTCGQCGESFKNLPGLTKHREFPNPCSDAFRKSPTATKQPKLHLRPVGHPPGYVDLDVPQSDAHSDLRYESSSAMTDVTDLSNQSGVFCRECKQTFPSGARYDHHKLGCAAKSGKMDTGPAVTYNNTPTKKKGRRRKAHSSHLQPLAEIAEPAQPSMFNVMHGRPPVDAPRREPARNEPTLAPTPSNPYASAAPTPTAAPLKPTSTPSESSSVFMCGVGGCQKSCKSEAGLKVHKQDAHNIGGQALDFSGKDSWMLSQRERVRLKEEALLRGPGSSSFGRRGPPPMGRPLSSGPAARTLQPHIAAMINASLRPAPAPVAPTQIPVGQLVSGPAEMEQANRIYDQILRLLISTDIIIQHDGKIVCSGIAWTRIGVERQPAVVGMLEKFIHLPAKMQYTEYVLSPKAFKEDNAIYYPPTDFERSPVRVSGQPALGTVALSCSKVVLVDGRQDVVKISAIDVLSCRVLLDHLVCTDPTETVKDWRTKTTGMTSWKDMEAARQEGYKVLKGWKAARAALWKFIDNETIVVGLNLRNDMDALRMIHGRAVDIAKSVEKAADGALSKQQLSLESICRDFPAVHLVSHPRYGQDVLQSAFGVRETILWMLKHEPALTQKAKAKSQDYQRLG
ncbi:hypothetical protein CC80DRAFT_399135 [Byssothecium circinans]|uniref:C2H2-type domain-containing protein n=1 Tax=Byssothecium circinans TaxID=147558 RepID=A0A6A5UGY1_9PLEO|nr:hypothetical protein CC80DRAFT_399135 [Byssothecium circinans]